MKIFRKLFAKKSRFPVRTTKRVMPPHLANVKPFQLREVKRKLRETSVALEATFDLIGWWNPATTDGSSARIKVRQLFNNAHENILRMAQNRSWVSYAKLVAQVNAMPRFKGKIDLNKLPVFYKTLGPLRVTYELELMGFKNELFEHAKELNLTEEKVGDFISSFEGACVGIDEHPALVDAHFNDFNFHWK